MAFVTGIASVLLALVMLASAYGKLRLAPNQVQTLTRVGVTQRLIPVLAALEIAAALGLLAGLFWAPIGIAAAAGVVAYFIGAVGSHLRVKDFNVTAPAVLLLAGGAVLTLSVATL
ncbi:DoxX family protein [Nonomuraea fuscirosea]|uniref:DoxX family protein n=1 Tax=Nonomuraea fuscirosea TaxID=1291556 RepID=UPI00343A8E26